MMLISAISKAVKTTAKIQNVSSTDDDYIPLMAALRGIRSWIVHG